MNVSAVTLHIVVILQWWERQSPSKSPLLLVAGVIKPAGVFTCSPLRPLSAE